MRILKVDHATKIQALGQNEYFECLAAEDLQGILKCVSLREYERGEMLFTEGEESDGLHIVESGCVKIYRLSPHGRQYIVRILMEGDTFNEVSIFDGKGNPVNAEALEDSRLWVVEAACVRQLAHSNPEFAQKVIENFSRNLRHLVQSVSEMAFYQVTHRLARLLLELQTNEQGAMRLTQDQIAARLGTVREVVARSLKELERSGAIQVAHRHILITDAKALSQWVQEPWN